MNAIEIGILAILGVGLVVAWTVAVLHLKDELRRKAREIADAHSFPIEEGEEITVHELGEIEGSIQGLVRVIVAAHRVEEPTNALRRAVRKNLENGVEYHFLVSKSRAKDELDGWIHMFFAIAHVALRQTGSSADVSERVRISNLSYDWRDTPYVFYEAKGAKGQLSRVAFRGNQTDEGIAEKYVRLPANHAYSLALAILSDAPQPMKVVEYPFLVTPTIDPRALEEPDFDEGKEYEHTN